VPHAKSTPREHAPTGDDRRAEREAAYAKNPDQPMVARPGNGAPAPGSALMHGHGGRGPGHRGARPVPALLMKRPAREPEKV